MKKWDIFIGADPFIGTIKNNSVFIDPDEKKLERLKENFSQVKNNVSCFFKKYTISADYKTVKWYLFSDNRFDGPLKLIDWNVNLPNLKEIESIELSGISLSDLLDECLEKNLDNNSVSITIRNGNPLEVINSLNHWIDFVEEIKLEHEYFISKWYEVFNNEMFKLGYFNSKIKNNCWENSYLSSELRKYKILKINFNNLDMELAIEKQSKESAEKEIINLKNDLASEKQSKESAEKEIINLKNDLASEKQSKESAEKEIINLKNQLASEKQRKESAEKEIINLKNDLASEKQSKECAENEIINFKNELVSVKQITENGENEINRISNELEIERKSHENSKEELSKKKILLLELNNDIDKIINNLD